MFHFQIFSYLLFIQYLDYLTQLIFTTPNFLFTKSEFAINTSQNLTTLLNLAFQAKFINLFAAISDI